MEIFNKNGFTFVELMVSVTISVIVFLIIFSFVVDSITSIAVSNKKAIALSSFYDMYDTIGGFREDFINGVVIIDNHVLAGSDVAIIKSKNNDKGMVFGVINKDTMKLETGSLYYEYGNKVLGYKLLSLSELTNIQTNTGKVFDLSFKNATIFDTPIKSFQSSFFNSGSIFLVDLELPIAHNPIYDGKSRTEIPKSNYELFNLSFTF